MNGFNSWWRTRTLREQRLLLAVAGLAAIVLAWLLVVRPLGDALAQARERHGEAVIALAEARANAERLGQLQRGAPAALPMPLDSLLGQSAGEAGFPISRIERDGPNQAVIVLDSVRPQAFFGWLSRLEADRGLIVERLSATTNSDRTLAIQATIRTRRT